MYFLYSDTIVCLFYVDIYLKTITNPLNFNKSNQNKLQQIYSDLNRNDNNIMVRQKL